METDSPNDRPRDRFGDWNAQNVTIIPAEGKTMSNYGRKHAVQRNGANPFRDGPQTKDFNVDSFWRWSTSDLLSNATRGVLAEFIVARALEIDVNTSVRAEWDAYDLLTPEGVKVEVKSCAFLQSWHQDDLSKITFSIRKSREWEADTNILSSESRRQADVYVFALLAHKDKATVDPIDLAQWQFYVVPTSTLDERARSQHSITLPSLQALTSAVTFDGLQAAIANVSGSSSGSA